MYVIIGDLSLWPWQSSLYIFGLTETVEEANQIIDKLRVDAEKIF